MIHHRDTEGTEVTFGAPKREDLRARAIVACEVIAGRRDGLRGLAFITLRSALRQLEHSYTLELLWTANDFRKEERDKIRDVLGRIRQLFLQRRWQQFSDIGAVLAQC